MSSSGRPSDRQTWRVLGTMYRLFAREVIPHFKGQLASPRASHDWAVANRGKLFGRAGQAIMEAITTHVEEKAATTSAATPNGKGS